MNEFLNELVNMMEMMEPVENLEAKIGRWTIEINTRTYRTPMEREITFTRVIEQEEQEVEETKDDLPHFDGGLEA